MASIDLLGTHSGIPRHLNQYSNMNGVREHRIHWNTIVAAETGISTVFDFKAVERAVARPHIHPIAYVDGIFLRHPTKFRVCLNIDELANLTFIPPHSDDGARATISRNCGPGSLLIGYAMRYCTSNDQSDDYEGKLASLGKVNQGIVDRFLDARDYLRQPPSLNIATEMFGDHDAQQLIDECLYHSLSEHDTLATITRVTAQNILKQYQRLLRHFFPAGQEVDELFICGPSAKNLNIIDYLETELPEGVITRPLHDIGIPSEAHEAVCYAHLAFEGVLSQVQTQQGPASPSEASQNQTSQPQTPQTQTPQTAPTPSPDAVKARVVPGRRWEDLQRQAREFSGGQSLPPVTEVRISGGLEAAVQWMDLR